MNGHKETMTNLLDIFTKLIPLTSFNLPLPNLTLVKGFNGKYLEIERKRFNTHKSYCYKRT